MNDNLLCDPVIRVRGPGGPQLLTLPGVLAALRRDEVDDFPALRAHQRHAWHAFLCQLAVMALEQAGETGPGIPDEEGRWRELLRGLTPDYPGDEPWRLVVEDLTKPAFLQPPVPEGSLRDFKKPDKMDVASPYALDVRVTAKAHDEKSRAPLCVTSEDWMLGLLMFQTFSGFFGSGNYGIARQNKGFSARHAVSLTFSLRPGAIWLRDCRILLISRDKLRFEGVYPEEGGKRLLWLESWGGGKAESLPLSKLHPLFIEVCRRIRLQRVESGRIEFQTKITNAARVAADKYNGVVGDPWIPVDRSENEFKAFNKRPSYDQVHPVLFDSAVFTPALLQRFHLGDPRIGASVLFRVFRRGQGRTEGYFERVIPIPKKGLPFLDGQEDRAARVASRMTQLAKDARKDVLKTALLQLVQPARGRDGSSSSDKRPRQENSRLAYKELDYKQKETNAWTDAFLARFEDRVDAEFFPLLWDCLDAGAGTEEADGPDPWSEALIRMVREEFKRACDALPASGALRYRALARAELVLERGIAKHLKPKEEA